MTQILFHPETILQTPAVSRNAVYAPTQTTLWSASAQGTHAAQPVQAVQASIVIPTVSGSDF